MKNSHLEKIKKLNYIPVGLGTDKFDKEWTTDNTGKNISFKNKFYGENTFHYWLWKNQLKDCFEKTWVGFCHYRRFWVKNPKVINFERLNYNLRFSKLEIHGLIDPLPTRLENVHYDLKTSFNIYKKRNLEHDLFQSNN